MDTSNTVIASVVAASNAAASSNQTSVEKEVLGQDEFLKLLVTQLKYQNPLEPVKDQDFIAQMASFTSLEQMKNLNTSFTNLSKDFNSYMVNNFALQQTTGMVDMIGQEVNYQNPDSVDEDGNVIEDILTGKITSVLMKQGVPFFMVNDQVVSLNRITEIGKTD